MVISVNILGKEIFARSMNRFAAAVQDWRPAFEDIWQNYLQITRKNFRSQGYPEPFRKLSPAYAAWKGKHYPGKPILQRSGALMQSMLGNRGGVGTVKDIRKLSAEFGTTLARALAHQDGTRNMPARKPLQLQDDNLTFWTRIIHEWAYKEATK